VALFLQEESRQGGLFDELDQLSIEYQAERADSFEGGEPTRLLLQALVELSRDGTADPFVFAPSAVSDAMNRIAREDDLVDGPDPFSARSVGRLLKSLRFEKARRAADKKLWKVTREDLADRAASYGVPVHSDPPAAQTNGTNGTNGITAQEPGAVMPFVPMLPTAVWDDGDDWPFC
jgi:hypothetical protein